MKPFDAAIILAMAVALVVTAIYLWREPLAPILDEPMASKGRV